MIQSTSLGTVTLSGAYTVNQAGVITGVSPAWVRITGGYTVVITGVNLGAGSDITSVTLCGVAARIVSQNATQVVVTAAAGSAGLGNVTVSSISTGLTVAHNAFTYTRPVLS